MARLTTVSRHPFQLGLIAGASWDGHPQRRHLRRYGDTCTAIKLYACKGGRKIGRKTGIPLGKEDDASNRRQGLGALLGLATGLGTGAAYGLLRSRTHVPFPVAVLGLSAAAMAGSDVPMAALGLTDPRKWPASSWVMDVVLHLAYGAAAAAAYEVITRSYIHRAT
ncbi:hypothetical protein [Arthrobacter sp. H14]|uniref:hypothetical protein n=1 Tax=Arthrobacter sp. H14 TaxID=1312959 RepID=UPI001C1E8590|nr:hypothetical protein [Arthrobacter sp. H14]